ncbi:MAG TPA: response regulator [Oculatellaceae cyanobacterium]
MTRLLIIEDDKDFADILKECLEEDEDLEIAAVIGDEESAMEFIRGGGLSGIHCVLADLQLPKTKNETRVNSSAGLRILEEIRHGRNFYGTIIILTSSKAPEDGQRALAAGCDGYLCKHAPIADIPSMLDELKIAIKGNVMIVSSEMRHVFFRDDVSAKEARLMDLLVEDKSWAEIAQELNYKTPKAAANIADRIYDKLIPEGDKQQLDAAGTKKRQKALEIWRSRHGR